MLFARFRKIDPPGRVFARPPRNIETPKKHCGAYIRCMSIERMRERLAADRASFVEPCLPSPADTPPSGPNWIHESRTTAIGSWPGATPWASGYFQRRKVTEMARAKYIGRQTGDPPKGEGRAFHPLSDVRRLDGTTATSAKCSSTKVRYRTRTAAMTGAQFEIRIDGTPRSYRDRNDYAMEATRFLRASIRRA
jgi:hypothetical protein